MIDRKVICWLPALLLFVFSSLAAQEKPGLFPLKDWTDTLKMTLLNSQVPGPLLLPSFIDSGDSIVARFQAGDLEVDFPKNDIPRGFNHLLEVRLVADREQPRLLTGWAEIDYTAEKITARWLDAAEAGLYPGKEYQVIRKYILLGPVECGRGKPKLQPLTLLPSAAVSLLGTAVLAYGINRRNVKNTQYAAYFALWAEEQDEDSALPFLKDAERAESRQKWTLPVGGVIVMVGLAWLGDRLLKHRKRTKSYETYCNAAEVKADRWQFTLPRDPGVIGVGLAYNLSSVHN